MAGARLGGIIETVIGAYIMIAIVPGAISTAVNTSTVGWPAAVAAIWGVVAIALVAAGLMMIVRG